MVTITPWSFQGWLRALRITRSQGQVSHPCPPRRSIQISDLQEARFEPGCGVGQASMTPYDTHTGYLRCFNSLAFLPVMNRATSRRVLILNSRSSTAQEIGSDKRRLDVVLSNLPCPEGWSCCRTFYAHRPL